MNLDARHISALDKQLQALIEAVTSENDDDIWMATGNALDWVYRCEEWLRNHNDDYYARRDASRLGQIVAGLVWVRGNVAHGSWNVSESIMIDALVGFVAPDGSVHPMTIWWFEDGKIVYEKEGPKKHYTWLHIADLPEPRRKETRGRDVHYEQRVAGLPVSEPFRLARFFLVGDD